ncbi:MAG: cytochrome c maturation protein CcmE [Alteraurantiacibacter sp.]
MSARLKPKHQRLVLVVIALVALIGATLLAIYALRDQASYFYVPADIAANPPAPGQAIRLGGMVAEGSLAQAADGVTVEFTVQDGEAAVPVTYTGIVPDLFVEGSGVVADGRMNANGVFVADNLLAKHDENYMPRELEGMDRAELREELQDSVE